MSHKTSTEISANSATQSTRAAVNSYLAREAEACSDTGHGCRDEVVEVTVGRSGQLQRAETDVVQSLVVNAVRFIRVLNKLMHGQCCIVRLHDRVRHLYSITTASAATNLMIHGNINTLCFSFNCCVFNAWPYNLISKDIHGTINHSHRGAGGAGAPPGRQKKLFFQAFFVGMRQKWG